MGNGWGYDGGTVSRARGDDKITLLTMVMAECRRGIATRLSGVNSITACYRAHAATVDQPNSAVHIGTRAARQEQDSSGHILSNSIPSAIQHRAHQSVEREPMHNRHGRHGHVRKANDVEVKGRNQRGEAYIPPLYQRAAEARFVLRHQETF